MRKIDTGEKTKKTIEFPTGKKISREETETDRKKAFKGITVGTFLILFIILYVPSLPQLGLRYSHGSGCDKERYHRGIYLGPGSTDQR